MGAFFETISPSLIQWILEQQMFTVATAPLRGDGHVNVSPKGGKYFGVIDEKTFWYQELSGSGSETVSHLYEPGNGRITIMFNAFDGPPRILRLYGTGRCLEGGSADFHDFVKRHKVDCIPGTRSIIIVDVKQVGTSCGFSVPYYDFVGHRDILNNFYRKKQEKYDAGDEKEHLPRLVDTIFSSLVFLIVNTDTGLTRTLGAWMVYQACTLLRRQRTLNRSSRSRRW